MEITPDQIRAARALLRVEQTKLAQDAGVSIATLRRLEARVGHSKVTPATVDRVRHVLERAGAEFIERGVRRRTENQAGSALVEREIDSIGEQDKALPAEGPAPVDGRSDDDSG
jgi:transcriptional regulator with XRE-family HTH domain